MFPKNFISVKTNDSQFLIISLFQTLMIFQQTIYQNFIHILIISQYDSQKLHLQDHPIRLRQWCIYIYIYTKETVFERISHNKQFLDGLGGAAAHALTNSMTLYWSAVSGSVFRGEADSTSAPPASPSMSLQHVIVLFDTLSLISSPCNSRLPSFHTQKEIDDGAILLKKLYVSRSSNIQWWHAKGQVYFFAWYGKNGDGFQTQLAL